MTGRDGVPLKYLCCENDVPDPTPQRTFLDEYINMAHLDEEAFTTDTAEVHTLLVSFISRNALAESKIQAHKDENNGRATQVSQVTSPTMMGAKMIKPCKGRAGMDSLGRSPARENLPKQRQR